MVNTIELKAKSIANAYLNDLDNPKTLNELFDIVTAHLQTYPQFIDEEYDLVVQSKQEAQSIS
jgi:hypothetical protein